MSNEYFEDLIQIQKVLINIDDDSFQLNEGQIIQSIKNGLQPNAIIYNIINMVKYRPSKANYYSQLIISLFQTNEQIKNEFLSLLFEETPSVNYEQRIPQIYLLFLLIHDNFYTIKTIISLLQAMNEKATMFYLIFAWFCPEIQKENRYFFDSIISNHKISNDWPQPLKLFYSNLDKFQDNEWQLLIELRENSYEKKSIMYQIKNGQLINNLFDYFDKRIRVSIFEINWILWNYPNYAEFSAFYGSLTNLQFLIENGFNFSEDFQTIDLLSFAIAGGNRETINYLLQKVGIKKELFLNSEFISILFFQNDFINKIEKEKYSSMFGSLGQVACSSNNLYILKKMNFNFDNHIDYLLSSIENGESNSAHYLIDNYESKLYFSDEFLLKLIQYEYKTLIMKLIPKHSSFLLKNILLLKKRNLFRYVIENNKCLCDVNIEDDLIFLSIFLKEENLFFLLIKSFPSKINIKTSQNETLLSLAVQQELLETVKFILDLNVIDINESDVFKSFSFIR